MNYINSTKIILSQDKVCAAPNCFVDKFNTSQHCFSHRKQFVPVYKKYKKAQKTINKYIIQPSSISDLNNESLLKVMSVCNKVVVMRKNYHIVAFKPELDCDGGSHKNFIEKLIKMTTVITRVLEERFSKPPSFSHSTLLHTNVESVIQEEEWIVTNSKVNASIISFKSMNVDLHKELDLLISQNQTMIKTIKSEIKHCYDAVNTHLKAKLDINNKISILACYVELVEEMYNQALLEMIIVEETIFDLKALIPKNQNIYALDFDVIRKLQTKTICKLYLNKMPNNFEELEESIYQGNHSTIVKKKPIIYIITAMLIDKVREKGFKDLITFNFNCSPDSYIPKVILQ